MAVARPYPMYGLWMAVHNMLDGCIWLIYGCTVSNIYLLNLKLNLNDSDISEILPFSLGELAV